MRFYKTEDKGTQASNTFVDDLKAELVHKTDCIHKLRCEQDHHESSSKSLETKILALSKQNQT